MDGRASTDSFGDAMSHWWRAPAAHKVQLVAGVAAVVVYAVGDVLSGLLYDGYSHRDQAISELSAFGSPVRPLMVTAILAHGVLLLAYGLGVLRAARRKSVWWMGALLVAIGFLGLPTHTVWAMSSRDMDTGFNDTMHITLSAVFSLFVVTAMVLSAAAYRGWFRLYSLATIVVVTGFGMASAVTMGASSRTTQPGRAASSGLTPTPTSRASSSWPPS